MYILKRKYFIIASILFFVCTVQGSNLKVSDTLITPSQIIDSLLLSENLDWSVRLVSNFKQQQFRLSNEDSRLLYLPNNPYGIGFGIANQKMVIDVVFNLKTEDEDHTTKFAAEGALILAKNLFGFAIENVNGYSVSSKQNEEEEFRRDISMSSIGLEYLRVLGKNDITVRGMKAGLPDTHKTLVSYGFGGFLLWRDLDADASIIPEADKQYFNEQAEIYDMSGFGAGILGGVSAYFSLPAHFFATAYVAPGIGIEYKYIKTESGNYIPSNPLLIKTDFFASLGYNREKFYINFTFGTDWFFSSLDFDNNIFLSVTKSKFVVGYNLGKVFKRKKTF